MENISTEGEDQSFMGMFYNSFLAPIFGLCRQRRRAEVPAPQDDLYNKLANSVTPSYTRLAKNIKKSVKKEASGQHYSAGLLMTCIEALIEICQKEYKVITEDYRRRRREVMEPEAYKIGQYEQCIEDFNDRVEIVLNQHLSYVIKDCGLEIMKYQSSYKHWEGQDQQFQQFAYTIIDQ